MARSPTPPHSGNAVRWSNRRGKGTAMVIMDSKKRWRRAQRGEADCWEHVPVADPAYLARKHQFWLSVLGLLPPQVTAGRRVLDMGCGPSGVLATCQLGEERVGVDPLMEHYLRLNPGLRALPVTWEVGEVETYQPREPFDLVISFNSLDHCYAPDAGVRNLRACTRDGGYALVSLNVHQRRLTCAYYRVANRVIDPMHPHTRTIGPRAM